MSAHLDSSLPSFLGLLGHCCECKVLHTSETTTFDRHGAVTSREFFAALQSSRIGLLRGQEDRAFQTSLIGAREVGTYQRAPSASTKINRETHKNGSLGIFSSNVEACTHIERSACTLHERDRLR
jgi:hypothetical protein